MQDVLSNTGGENKFKEDRLVYTCQNLIGFFMIAYYVRDRIHINMIMKKSHKNINFRQHNTCFAHTLHKP